MTDILFCLGHLVFSRESKWLVSVLFEGSFFFFFPSPWNEEICPKCCSLSLPLELLTSAVGITRVISAAEKLSTGRLSVTKKIKEFLFNRLPHLSEFCGTICAELKHLLPQVKREQTQHGVKLLHSHSHSLGLYCYQPQAWLTFAWVIK